MGRGYSGNHPRFSHRQDERYDAKEAYNKDLTASARLHYLENDRHDHESPAHSHCSPMHMHNDRHIRRQAEKIARKNEGDVQDIYYELKAKAARDERSGRKKVDDERSGEVRNQMIDEMLDDRPDSPMNRIDKMGQRIINQSLKSTMAGIAGDHKKEERHYNRAMRMNERDQRRKARKNKKGEEANKASMPDFDKAMEMRKSFSPMNACAKSEGGKGCIQQMGGAWRVISNKTDKPWPAKYASKSKAEAALRGYHAG